MKRRTMIILGIASLLLATTIFAARQDEAATKPEPPPQPTKPTTPKAPVKPVVKQAQPRPKVDIVVALDTSGSMSGLINATRQKLWDIVNEVAKAQPTPRLRVGLVTFGSVGSEADGYVVINSELTTDLDTIYEKLFQLSTRGGTEYVGRAVHRSVKEMGWDKDPDTLRQIYVAGNESADQDRRVKAVEAVKLARKHDIFVNTIYCGNEGNSDAASWRAVANTGLGAYASIDHNHGTVAVATPFDARLNALSGRLNGTYVAYGATGGAGFAKQAAQDKNAARVHASTGASRALAKASAVYNNPNWDLVDARKAGKLKTIAPAAMPAPLRGKSDKEIKAYIDDKEKERGKLRKQIVELSKKRQAFVKAELKKKGISTNKAFDTVVKRALRRQAKMKKIRLK
jgi:von Willebrand factor type A domain